MATVTNPTAFEIYSHDLRTHLKPGEVVEVDDDVADAVGGTVLVVDRADAPVKPARAGKAGKAKTGPVETREASGDPA